MTLALAVPALVFAVWPSLVRRGDRLGLAAAAGDDERAALENEKIVALRAIRELELDHEAGHLADEDYRDLRARYEGDAAAVLRQLDALGPAAKAPRGRRRHPAGPERRRPLDPAARGPRRVGAGLLVFGVVLGLLVSRYSTPAPPEPGDEPAGRPPGMPSRGIGTGIRRRRPAPAHPEGDARGDAPGRPPEPGRRPLPGSHRRLHGRPPPRADQRRRHHPPGRDPRLAGHHADALEAFDRALAIDPNYAHALWDKAGSQEARQDHAGAVATLERFVRVAPPGPDRDRAQERIREAKARLAAMPKAAAPGGRAGAPAMTGRASLATHE